MDTEMNADRTGTHRLPHEVTGLDSGGAGKPEAGKPEAGKPETSKPEAGKPEAAAARKP